MSKIRKLLGIIIFWITYPGIYLLISKSHRTRVIICAEDEVLFVNNWLSDGKLSLPGGGIKSNEESSVAAIREVYEETGIKLKKTDLKLLEKDINVKETGIKYLVDCYSVNLPKILSTSSNHLEILESSWLPWKKVVSTNSLTKTTNQLMNIWLESQHLVN